jgi:hypothetical protein
MIQRIQTVFLLISVFSLLLIIFYVPVLRNETLLVDYLLYNSLEYVRWIIFCSVVLSLYAIFQYKNMKRQKLIVSISRLCITISLILIVFVYKDENIIKNGTLLLLIPFLSLIFANYYIMKDEKLINSSDRIR